MKLVRKSLLLLALSAVPVAGLAQDIRWLNAAAGDWSNAANWFNNSGPNSGTSTRDVYIDFAPYALTGGIDGFATNLAINSSINRLFSRATINFSAGALTLNAAGSQSRGTLNWSGGLLNGAGKLGINGVLNVTGNIQMQSGIEVFGTANIGTHSLFTVNSTSEIKSGGAMNLADTDWRDGIINVAAGGLLRKNSGAGTATLMTSWNGGPRAVNNAGTVSSTSGVLSLVIGGTHTGAFNGSGGGQVHFNGGTHQMDANASLGAGAVLNSATISFNGTHNVSGFEIKGGAITGNGTLTGTGFTTTGGNISIGGTLKNNTTLNMTSGDFFAVNSTFTNNGVFDIKSDSFVYRDGIFNNVGTLKKTGGPGAVTFGLGWNGGPREFNNSGVVTSSSGDLVLEASGSHTGSFSGTSGGRVIFPGGSSHTMQPGAVMNAGSVISGATVTLAVGAQFNNGQFSSGTLTGGGSINGTLLLTAGNKSINGNLVNNGVIKFQDGDVFAVNGTFTNKGTLEMENGRIWRDGIFINEGTIRRDAAGPDPVQLNISWSGGPRELTNKGTVTSTAGEIQFMVGGVHTGITSGTGTGIVAFQSGTFDFNTGAKLNAGTVLRGVQANLNGAVEFNGASFPGNNGILVGNGGSINGTGLFMNSAGGQRFGGVIENNSLIDFSAGDVSAINSTLNNKGTFIIGTDLNYRDGIMNNSGLFKKVGSGVANMNFSWSGGPRALHNTGTVRSEGGTLKIFGPGTHTGLFETSGSGRIEFVDQPKTFNTGASLQPGVAFVQGTHTIAGNVDVNAATFEAGELTGSGRITGGTLIMPGGGSRRISGGLIVESRILAENPDVTAINSVLTIEGEMEVNNSMQYRDGVILNKGYFHKTGVGSANLNFSWSGGPRGFANQGVVEVEGGTLNLEGGYQSYDPSSRSITGGKSIIQNNCTLRLGSNNQSIFDNRSRIVFFGGAATFNDNGNNDFLRNLKINRDGLEFRDGKAQNFLANVENAGDVYVDQNSTASVGANKYTQATGVTRIDGGFTGNMDVTGGTLRGNGTISGNVVNLTGTVWPGTPTGILTVNSFKQNAGGTLRMTVGGPSGRLNSVGNVDLDGTLLVEALPGVTIPNNTTFRIIGAGGVRAGTFTTVPNPADWQVVYGANFVDITSKKAIVGPKQISGKMDLGGFNGNYVAQEVTFEVFKNGNLAETTKVTMEANGDYTFNTNQTGVVDVFAKASHWLRKKTAGVSLGVSGASNVNISLINGDIDGDNYVGTDDYLILNAAFDSSFPEPEFKFAADLNGDYTIGSDDYLILNQAFDTQGD